jgi:hypothetical protein
MTTLSISRVEMYQRFNIGTYLEWLPLDIQNIIWTICFEDMLKTDSGYNGIYRLPAVIIFQGKPTEIYKQSNKRGEYITEISNHLDVVKINKDFDLGKWGKYNQFIAPIKGNSVYCYEMSEEDRVYINPLIHYNSTYLEDWNVMYPKGAVWLRDRDMRPKPTPKPRGRPKRVITAHQTHL